MRPLGRGPRRGLSGSLDDIGLSGGPGGAARGAPAAAAPGAPGAAPGAVPPSRSADDAAPGGGRAAAALLGLLPSKPKLMRTASRAPRAVAPRGLGAGP